MGSQRENAAAFWPSLQVKVLRKQSPVSLVNKTTKNAQIISFFLFINTTGLSQTHLGRNSESGWNYPNSQETEIMNNAYILEWEAT